MHELSYHQVPIFDVFGSNIIIKYYIVLFVDYSDEE